MGKTYSKIYIMAVFAVKGRENNIRMSFKDELHKYISGILKNEGVYPLAVGGWKDHVHVLFTMQPNHCISDIIRVVKSNSSKWLNENFDFSSKFQWQEGFGAFSYHESRLEGMIQYIMHQEQHHSNKTFKEEYYDLLKEFNMDILTQNSFQFEEE